MSVSRSIIQAKMSTARATPSMRPANSSNSVVSIVIAPVVIAMAKLCQRATGLPTAKTAFCLEAPSPGGFQ